MRITHAIRALRHRAGLSMAQAAKRAGWRQASSYQRYEDDAVFKRQYLPMDVAQRLVRAFAGLGSPAITPEEVLALTQPLGARLDLSLGSANHSSMSLGVVEVFGVAEVGVWREALESPQETRRYLPRPYLPGYEDKEIFALEVRGSGAEPVYPDGSVVFFVSAKDLPPRAGHIVVVRTTRHDLVETTVRELRADERGRLILSPLHAGNGELIDDPKRNVEIIGVALARFEMLPATRR